MKNYKKIVTIKDIDYLHNSIYGNPKIKVLMQDENGEYLQAKTADNAACAYIFGYSSIGRKYKIEYHYTRNNNIIITRAKEA
jgi:hypothetical protein